MSTAAPTTPKPTAAAAGTAVRDQCLAALSALDRDVLAFLEGAAQGDPSVFFPLSSLSHATTVRNVLQQELKRRRKASSPTDAKEQVCEGHRRSKLALLSQALDASWLLQH